MRPLFALCALGLVLALPPAGWAQAPPAVMPLPGIYPKDFRVTTFATGLHFPESMQQLSDGSLLVGTSDPTGGNFFASTGELIRLVDANGDGMADGPGKVLYTGLPGEVTSVRLAGTLILVTSSESGSERITLLRQGAHPEDSPTPVGSINFAFPSNWEHTTYTLGVRPTPGSSGNQWDVIFNIGSQYNIQTSTQTVGVSGLVSGTLQGDSIYKVTLQDLGNQILFSSISHIARGLRNAAGIIFHPTTGDLYLDDNGIDTPSNPDEAYSADEINLIPAANIGGTVENFGYPSSYIQYRTGKQIGTIGIQPIVAFQPIPNPWTGSESEGCVEIAFSPAGFPPALRNGIFVGFHGRFALAGVANEENPLVYYDLGTGTYYDFVSNNEPNVGHLDGVLSTADSLFVADWSTTGGYSQNETGAIYQFKYAPVTALTVANRTGISGQTVYLRARLVSHGTPLSGKTIAFSVQGTAAGSAVTDVKGYAVLAYTIPTSLGTGAKQVTAVFAGDDLYQGSSGMGTLTVLAPSALTVDSVSGKAGQTVTLSATLTSGTTPLSGEPVTFSVQNVGVGTATTDSNGKASLSYTIPSSMSTGKKTLKAHFVGDSVYGASTGYSTLTVIP